MMAVCLRSVLVFAVLCSLCGCAQVHDRSYPAFEEARGQYMLKVGLDLAESGLLQEGEVAARAFVNIYSSTPFAEMRIQKVNIMTKDGVSVFVCAGQLSAAKSRAIHGTKWSHVARHSLGEKKVRFVDYRVEADVDLLDESGAIIEAFDVTGSLKAHTVSRPKWLPY